MYKKKISTIAIITILTLSIMLAAIPMATALTDDVSVTPNTGPVGQKVTVSGTGANNFAPLEVYWDTLGNKIKDGFADGTGGYSIANVYIPEDVAGLHDVIVYDTLSDDVQFATFTILPEIDLSTTKGLPGDSVTVTGTGFGDEKDVYTYLNTTAVTTESVTLSGYTNGTDTIANVTGTLGNKPIVQSPPLTNITFTTNMTAISVTDDGAGNLYGEALSGSDKLNATGTMNYATGFFNITIQNNATAAMDLNTPASADYTHYLYDVTPALGTTTSDLGSFSAVILIPSITEANYGAYNVTSIDTDENSDSAILTVDYYVTVTPPTGPTGITITIAGRIEADKAYELRFNAAPIATGTTAADGTFSNTYVIPSVLSIGSYPVDVIWDVTQIKSATFNVTAPPQVTYAPTHGVAGAVVKISTVAGYPFSANANITLYLGTTVVNSTQLDELFGPTGKYTGAFTDLEFTVPTLTPGPYALKVVDEFGASTVPSTFTVDPTPVTTAELRGTSYYPCCTLSFNIVTTEADLVPITVTIRDPSGAIWWTTAAWTLTGTVSKSVYYQDQLVNDNPIKLPLDAPLGSWNWTITYTPASTGIPTKATGLFTVAAEPDMQDVLDQLDTMEASIKSVVTTSEGKIIVAVNTKAGEIITDLDALGAKLQGIEDLGVVIATDVDDIQIDLAALDLTVLDALGVDITSIKGDVATIKSNIGTVTTAVSTLDAKVTSLSGDVATVSTTLGTLTGTVTSIDGNVATIDTEVGTLQADIADIDLDVDMTPAWIAVVLSLVAAIAAVFAVITIRQKIAG